MEEIRFHTYLLLIGDSFTQKNKSFTNLQLKKDSQSAKTVAQKKIQHAQINIMLMLVSLIIPVTMISILLESS